MVHGSCFPGILSVDGEMVPYREPPFLERLNASINDNNFTQS